MSTKTLLTGDDLWKIVADGSRYELSRGELVPMTSVGIRHAVVVSKLQRLLGDFVGKNQLGLQGRRADSIWAAILTRCVRPISLLFRRNESPKKASRKNLVSSRRTWQLRFSRPTTQPEKRRRRSKNISPVACAKSGLLNPERKPSLSTVPTRI